MSLKENLVRQPQRRKKPKYQCIHCPSKFDQHDYYINHLRASHSIVENKVQKLVRKITKDASFVAKAKKAAAGREATSPRKAAAAASSREAAAAAADELRCKECFEEFKRKDYLKNHLRGVHGIGGDARPFVCTRQGCGKSFTKKHNLKQHERAHTGAREHECAMCPASFGQKSHLTRHIKTLHLCKFCGSRVRDMKEHLAELHPGEKQRRGAGKTFRCVQDCGYTCTKPDSMREHQLTCRVSIEAKQRENLAGRGGRGGAAAAAGVAGARCRRVPALIDRSASSPNVISRTPATGGTPAKKRSSRKRRSRSPAPSPRSSLQQTPTTHSMSTSPENSRHSYSYARMDVGGGGGASELGRHVRRRRLDGLGSSTRSVSVASSVGTATESEFKADVLPRSYGTSYVRGSTEFSLPTPSVDSASTAFREFLKKDGSNSALFGTSASNLSGASRRTLVSQHSASRLSASTFDPNGGSVKTPDFIPSLKDPVSIPNSSRLLVDHLSHAFGGTPVANSSSLRRGRFLLQQQQQTHQQHQLQQQHTPSSRRSLFSDSSRTLLSQPSFSYSREHSLAAESTASAPPPAHTHVPPVFPALPGAFPVSPGGPYSSYRAPPSVASHRSPGPGAGAGAPHQAVGAASQRYPFSKQNSHSSFFNTHTLTEPSYSRAAHRRHGPAHQVSPGLGPVRGVHPAAASSSASGGQFGAVAGGSTLSSDFDEGIATGKPEDKTVISVTDFLCENVIVVSDAKGSDTYEQFLTTTRMVDTTATATTTGRNSRDDTPMPSADVYVGEVRMAGEAISAGDAMIPSVAPLLGEAAFGSAPLFGAVSSSSTPPFGNAGSGNTPPFGNAGCSNSDLPPPWHLDSNGSAGAPLSARLSQSSRSPRVMVPLNCAVMAQESPKDERMSPRSEASDIGEPTKVELKKQVSVNDWIDALPQFTAGAHGDEGVGVLLSASAAEDDAFSPYDVNSTDQLSFGMKEESDTEAEAVDGEVEGGMYEGGEVEGGMYEGGDGTRSNKPLRTLIKRMSRIKVS